MKEKLNRFCLGCIKKCKQSIAVKIVKCPIHEPKKKQKNH